MGLVSASDCGFNHELDGYLFDYPIAARQLTAGPRDPMNFLLLVAKQLCFMITIELETQNLVVIQRTETQKRL